MRGSANKPMPEHQPPSSSGLIMQVDDVSKSFGPLTAVSHASCRVNRGELCGLVGSDGAGKTTLLRMIAGMIPPTTGSIYIHGLDAVRRRREVKELIGYMSQKFSLYLDLTPFENIRFYLGIYNVPASQWKARTEWVFEIARLGDIKDRLTRDLPQGWRQRLALGCALLHRPRILFLDEPTSGVDPVTRRHFWAFIGQLASEGVTVFVTTHYMDEAQHCNRVIIINEGSIVARGAPGEIITDVLPGLPGADLNDAFVKLMRRSEN